MNNILKILIFFPLILTLVAFITENSYGQLSEESITIDGTERTYLIYTPEGIDTKNLPLVIGLHGHGGQGKSMMNLTDFNFIADKEKFVVSYPDGMNKSWNDGRNDPEENIKYNDVKFISALIDKLAMVYKIDTSQVFATGMSNGGIFSLYLAYKLSNKIHAIAPVTANIPEDISDEYKPEYPVSVMLINGTADPLINYEGGKVGFEIGKSRGRTISTDKTIEKFSTQFKCVSVPDIEKIPDINTTDGCTSVKYTYGGCTDNVQVVLIKVLNGGHTWPGGTQYLPKALIGNVCKDFRASEYIWNFFKSRIKK